MVSQSMKNWLSLRRYCHSRNMTHNNYSLWPVWCEGPHDLGISVAPGVGGIEGARGHNLRAFVTWGPPWPRGHGLRASVVWGFPWSEGIRGLRASMTCMVWGIRCWNQYLAPVPLTSQAPLALLTNFVIMMVTSWTCLCLQKVTSSFHPTLLLLAPTGAFTVVICTKQIIM